MTWRGLRGERGVAQLQNLAVAQGAYAVDFRKRFEPCHLRIFGAAAAALQHRRGGGAGDDDGAGIARERGQAAGVIEMRLGAQNELHLVRLEAELANVGFDAAHALRETGVNQY